jgi:hypothetical protein
MIWGIFMFPLLWLQETLSLATFSSNCPIESLPHTVSFSSVALKKQNYAPSVQKQMRVYCISFWNAPTVNNIWFSLVNVF